MPVNESLFPQLGATGFKITSPADPVYNCVAWAAGDTASWWWPDPDGFDYWPPGVPRECTIPAFVQAFATLGFTPCDDAGLEPGWEKLAIYALDGFPQHVTRQLKNGLWTSKLGPDEDIEHELHGLTGPTYGAVVQVLRRPIEVIQHVRLRPSMYIGDIGPYGLHNLLYELVFNSIDENLAGICTRIRVELLADGGCRVTDNGRGIPRPIILRDGAFFLPLKARNQFKVTGGLVGIGFRVVNALSARLELDSTHQGKRRMLEFGRGLALSNVREEETSSEPGTSIAFWPDADIFTSQPQFDFNLLASRFLQLAALRAGLTLELMDQRTTTAHRVTFSCPNGLADLVRQINDGKTLVQTNLFHCRDTSEGMECEIALQWTESHEEALCCFANLYLTNFGSHQVGFRRGLGRALGKFGRSLGLLGPKQLKAEQWRRGLTAVVAILVRGPIYEGATRARLANPEVQTFVEKTIYRRMIEFFTNNPEDAKAILKNQAGAEQ